MPFRFSFVSLGVFVLGASSACSGGEPGGETGLQSSGGERSTASDSGGAATGGGAGGETLSGGAGGSEAGIGGEQQGTGGIVEACNRPRESSLDSVEIDVDGTMRRFLFYVPAGYDGTTRLPLVFNLHPSGSNPEDHMTGTQMAGFADSKRFFVAAIAGIDGKWNVLLDPERPSEVELARKIIEYAEEQVCVDGGRIYSTGFSGGARTSSLLGCALSDRVSAIAPVAGIRNDPPCDGLGVNVLTLHGTSDETNYYNGCAATDTACSRNGEWVESVESALADWRVTNGCGGEPELQVLDGGVERRTWKTCASGTEVEFYKVPNGQHVWWLLPETTDIVTDFLLAH